MTRYHFRTSAFPARCTAFLATAAGAMQQGQSLWVPWLLFNAILRPFELPDSPYGMHLVTLSCGIGSLPKASGDPAWVVHRPVSPVSYSAELRPGGSFKGGQIRWRCEFLMPPQQVSGNTLNNVIVCCYKASPSGLAPPPPHALTQALLL